MAEGEKQNRRAARVAVVREHCARGWDLLGEIEKRGIVRLSPDGALIYSGLPLGDDLLLGIEIKALDVRIAIAQRWQDREILPAPAKAAEAA
ncbi:MAG: hypothetical protein ACREFZ_07190 [Acetobacteraceae bacterium]